jgi:hypothetical protein
MLGGHSMPNDDRQAPSSVADLITLARSLPPSDDLSRLIDEADALSRAIAAFHLEGSTSNLQRRSPRHPQPARFRRKPQRR